MLSDSIFVGGGGLSCILIRTGSVVFYDSTDSTECEYVLCYS